MMNLICYSTVSIEFKEEKKYYVVWEVEIEEGEKN